MRRQRRLWCCTRRTGRGEKEVVSEEWRVKNAERVGRQDAVVEILRAKDALRMTGADVGETSIEDAQRPLRSFSRGRRGFRMAVARCDEHD
jgi:hypothetical protein